MYEGCIPSYILSKTFLQSLRMIFCGASYSEHFLLFHTEKMPLWDSLRLNFSLYFEFLNCVFLRVYVKEKWIHINLRTNAESSEIKVDQARPQTETRLPRETFRGVPLVFIIQVVEIKYYCRRRRSLSLSPNLNIRVGKVVKLSSALRDKLAPQINRTNSRL